ncbi:MAG: carbohydrate-binding protein [Deltaproteobacteria bacterium]|nr:carbohydrate-binding protein [Deltaproteobacteria bacterium]
MLHKTVTFSGFAALVVALTLSAPLEAQEVELHPSSLRLTKGKSNTATALFLNAQSNYVPAVTFSFSSSNPGVASAGPAVTNGIASPNLASIVALNAGVTQVTASYNGQTSAPMVVTVDDPAASPVAEIHGDNDASGGGAITTYVGEPIEVDGESSLGVDSLQWDWGDGDLSTGVLSATHAYLEAGTFLLTLTTTNSSGASSTDTVVVTVQDFPPPTQTFVVTTQLELMDAYNQCSGGEHIVIPAGTTILGHIVLPARNLTDYVTIRSSATMPDIRDRIQPDHPGLVVFKGTFVNPPSLALGSSVKMLRFVGIKFEPVQQSALSHTVLVRVGEPSQTSLDQNPEKIIFQHCVIEPPDDTKVRHGFQLDGYKISLISGWFGNIQVTCDNTGCQGDSQVAYSVNGRGAHVYLNSYLEASTENILYGGADVDVKGHTPTNVEIRRCHFTKNEDWKPAFPQQAAPYSLKNLLELKIGRRIYVEGSVFGPFWYGGRDSGQGNAFNFGSLPERASPWTSVEDFVLENSLVSDVSGISRVSRDGSAVWSGYGARKVVGTTFKNVLVDGINDFAPANGASRLLVLANQAEDISFENITVVDGAENSDQVIWMESSDSFRFRLTDSIIGLGGGLSFFSSSGRGNCALNFGTGGSNFTLPCPQDGSWDVSGNIFVRYYLANRSHYPQDNCYDPFGYDEVGFVDLAGGDYRLSANRTCYPGQPAPGADIDLIEERTRCTVSGLSADCTAPPTGQSPYPGPAVPTLPGILEAENFDRGGAGVAYGESFGATGSGVYRSDPVETVDLQARSSASGGYAVFEAAAGEWLEYSVEVPNGGLYDLGVWVASEFNSGQFHLEVDGVDVTGPMTVTSTGNWGTFDVLTHSGIALTAGSHILRLAMDVNSPDLCGCVIGNFDRLELQASVSSGEISWVDLQNTDSNGGSVFRGSASSPYYGKAMSDLEIGAGQYVEWTHRGDPDVWVGLVNTATAGASSWITDIAYSYAGDIREFAVYKADGNLSPGDRVRISVDSTGEVTYYRNGTLVYTSQASATGSYRLFIIIQEVAGNGIDDAAVGNL